jgi:hypothetical protein
MDPTLLISIIGFGTLFIERLFTHLNRIRKSKCLGGEIEFTDNKQSEATS